MQVTICDGVLPVYNPLLLLESSANIHSTTRPACRVSPSGAAIVHTTSLMPWAATRSSSAAGLRLSERVMKKTESKIIADFRTRLFLTFNAESAVANNPVATNSYQETGTQFPTSLLYHPNQTNNQLWSHVGKPQGALAHNIMTLNNSYLNYLQFTYFLFTGLPKKNVLTSAYPQNQHVISGGT
jgi:hypothetical protein